MAVDPQIDPHPVAPIDIHTYTHARTYALTSTESCTHMLRPRAREDALISCNPQPYTHASRTPAICMQTLQT